MDRGLTRRAAAALLAGAPLAGCVSVGARAQFEAAGGRAAAPFRHGVASGDARSTRLILWTRVSLPEETGPVTVDWEMSRTPDFASLAAHGRATTEAQRDWTVKVDAEGLSPGTAYHYRFRLGERVSPVGRTRTLPATGTRRLRLAVVSCAHLSHGYFNVYDHIAREAAFDAVIHLGDYLYSQAPGAFAGAPDEIAGRTHQPPHEAKTLGDYRARHAQYKEDAGLQALHAAHPVYAIWDDHEIANDASQGGAPGHEGAEAEWRTRQAAALQAYHEWMPVRDAGENLTERYKTVRFGDFATLCLLETRASARDESLGFGAMAAKAAEPGGIEAVHAVFADAGREKLGAAQLAQLRAAFAAAGDGWLILANPTLMAPVMTPDVRPYLSDEALRELKARWKDADGFLAAAEHGLPLLPDSWDGYLAERDRLYAALRAAGRADTLVLTGDTHSWWVNELQATGGAPVGVELAASSVSAPSALGERLIGARARDLSLLITRDNPAVRYVSGESHGYIDLQLDGADGTARFVAVETAASPGYAAWPQAAFRLKRQDGRLDVSRPRGLRLKQRFLF
ncbi:MAG: alkaline phosphatase D family protein [Hyphomonas sp.]